MTNYGTETNQWIPDNDLALDRYPQSNVFSSSIASILRGIRGNGVLEGLQATGGGLTLKVNVAAGSYVIDSTPYTVLSSIKTLDAAEPSLFRIDLIVANASGVTVIKGTPSTRTRVKEPNLPDTYIPIAQVWIRPMALTVSESFPSKTIYDRRVFSRGGGAGDQNVVYISSRTTTMRASIQAAIDVLHAGFLATGDTGVVQLPAGSFTLEDTVTITLKNGVLVRGQGRDITILVAPTTAASYVMFTNAVVADGALVNLTANAIMGAASVSATAHGLVADDYFMLVAGAGIAEVGRVQTAAGTPNSFIPCEALHETFNTAASSQVKKITMATKLGLKDVTLDGTNVTGAAYGCLPNRVGLGCEFVVKTRNWRGNGTVGTGFNPSVVYGAYLEAFDEGSGSTTFTGIHPAYVSASVIKLWSYRPPGIASRVDFCHGNTIEYANNLQNGGRGFKFSASSGNIMSIVTSDYGHGQVGGQNRGLTFSDSSHHNTVGAVRAQNSAELDVWFDGGESGVNPTSAFSDSFNVIGALTTSGVASTSNIFVGTLARSNVIGACTPGATLFDMSGGLGLTIGNAAPIYVMAKDMSPRDGGPATYTALAGSGQRYGCFDMANNESVIFSVMLPRTYAGTQVRPVIHWTNRSAASGNVVWRASMQKASDAADINTATLTATDNAAVAAPAQDVLKRTAVLDAVQTATGGDLLTVLIIRNGTGDTLGANDVGLIGVEIIPA